ncbi:MAG TPA: 2-dehydropantoate 2-reductase [Flavobacteriales bacterium]|nr:2-dehydropantoate 2-reductase [Flavobacteriales bacterium]HRJ37545.1 2-dehydropantoate 2-reductase [Flavobacteriales bacterium]
MKPTKIIIAGIGGVGGYFGGLLAKQYFESEQIDIVFYVRGENLKAIQERGLKIIHGENERIAFPKLATNNPKEIGIADYILLCTKSYDLDSVLAELKPCVGPNTVILPLLNGVDSRAKIKEHFPDAKVWDGCVYIVARLIAPGEIHNSGNIQSFYFGLDTGIDAGMKNLEQIARAAGIEVTLSDSISKITWEKFVFLSPIATASSYYDKAIGELLSDQSCACTIELLIEEVLQIANAKGILLSADIRQRTLQKYHSLPPETTTSMHSDFKANKPKTELQSLTAYVVSEAKRYNLPVPNYEKLYSDLQNKCSKNDTLG